MGISLVIQWLRPCALNAGSPGLIPGQGTRSHMLQRSSKILCAATKTLSSPKINTPQPQNPYPAFFCFLCIYIPPRQSLTPMGFLFLFKIIYLALLDLHCSVQASHCSGFSCWGAWASGLGGFSSRGSWALEHRLSSCSTQA